jgi:predicted small metal-binding protein
MGVAGASFGLWRRKKKWYTSFKKYLSMKLTIACRDFGIDCDNFIRGEDSGRVLVDDFKHLREAHPELLKQMLAGMELWQVLDTCLKVMKREGGAE